MISINSHVYAEEAVYSTKETIRIDDSALKEKIKEAKSLGITINEDPVTNLGSASNADEETSLKERGAEEIRRQIEQLDSVITTEKSMKETKKSLLDAKKEWTEMPNKQLMLIIKVLAHDLSSDALQNSTVSNMRSSIGSIKYVQLDNINLRSSASLALVSDAQISDQEKITQTVLSNSLTNDPKYITRTNYIQESRIVKLRDNETISYTLTPTETSVLRSKLGIHSIDVNRKYTFRFKSETETYTFITNKLNEVFMLFDKIDRNNSDNGTLVDFIVEYTFKDEKGQPIPLNELYTRVINHDIFNSVDVIKSNDILIQTEPHVANLPNLPHVRALTPKSRTTQAQSDTQTVKQLFKYVFDASNLRIDKNARQYTQMLVSIQPIYRPFTNVNVEEALKERSANVHEVTYDKVTETGIVIQKFVDEQGNSIADDVRSNVLPVGSAIQLSHPNEIQKNQKRYVFKEQSINDVSTISHGETIIRYVYKDVTPKPIKQLPVTGTLGTIISIVSATSLLTLIAFLNKLKKTR